MQGVPHRISSISPDSTPLARIPLRVSVDSSHFVRGLHRIPATLHDLRGAPSRIWVVFLHFVQSAPRAFMNLLAILHHLQGVPLTTLMNFPTSCKGYPLRALGFHLELLWILHNSQGPPLGFLWIPRILQRVPLWISSDFLRCYTICQGCPVGFHFLSHMLQGLPIRIS